MPVDVLMSTFGGREVVEESLHRLFGFNAGASFRLWLYDNPISQKDGTRDVAASYRDRADVELGQVDIHHSAALDRLMKKGEAEWVLTLDSDVFVREDDWLGAPLAEAASGNEGVLYGEMVPPYRPKRGKRKRLMWLPRIHPAFCLVRRDFFEGRALSFAGCDLRVSFRGRTKSTKDEPWAHHSACELPPAWFMGEMGLQPGEPCRVCGDTGWQLLFTASWFPHKFRVGLMSPAAVKFRHLGSASFEFLRKLKGGEAGKTTYPQRLESKMGRPVIVKCVDGGEIHGRIAGMDALKKRVGQCLVLMDACMGEEPEVHDRIFVNWDQIKGVSVPRRAVSGGPGEPAQENVQDHGERFEEAPPPAVEEKSHED